MSRCLERSLSDEARPREWARGGGGCGCLRVARVSARQQLRLEAPSQACTHRRREQAACTCMPLALARSKQQATRQLKTAAIEKRRERGEGRTTERKGDTQTHRHTEKERKRKSSRDRQRERERERERELSYIIESYACWASAANDGQGARPSQSPSRVRPQLLGCAVGPDEPVAAQHTLGRGSARFLAPVHKKSRRARWP